jgi:glucose/arabinose dehydrogenase
MTTSWQRFAACAAPGIVLGLLDAQSVPSGFAVQTLVSSGLTAPNDFCFLPDGRILFANRPGGVSVYAGGSLATVGTVPNVETGQERALLGIAADPGFATNGYVYVWYSSLVDAFMHLDRFTCTGDLANAASTNLTFNPATRRVILANVPDNAFNHNGGSPRFGPDGMLYQSIGDDASGCQAQLTNTQQGALLRMDVSQLGPAAGTTPPTFAQLNPGNNPLSANTDFSQLLIAHGLRNPVRMTIDPVTNNLYIGDVGQNAHEEYTEYVYQQGGLQLVNFGWPWREGNFAYSTCTGTQPPGLVPPLVDIPQTQGWLSVMGGPRYRNRGGQFDFGPSYEGKAFYGDYFAGQIRMLQNAGGTWSPAPAVTGQPTPTNWAQGIVGLVSYDVGPDGALYLLQHPTTYATAGGFLKRIVPTSALASATVRTGAGNFNTNYTCTPPALGRVMTAQINVFGTPYTIGVVYGCTQAASLPFGTYTILVDTASPLVLELPFRNATGGVVVRWDLSIPNLPSLFGMPIKSQALMLGPDVALTNAVDLVLGY